jgi:hypothetical protein
MPPRRKSLEEYFWLRVKKTDGCWLWTGRKAYWGYGSVQLYAGAPRTGAHRASWQIHYGKIPEGLWVLHKCDNPQCVRPDHLFLGTNTDNMRDCWAKGRGKAPDSRARMALKTSCANGHQFTDESTYWHNGHRKCRICHMLHERIRRSRRLAEQLL